MAKLTTAIYCRLSRENDDLSGSIANQESMAKRYIRNHSEELSYLRIYEDVGETRTNFDRPGWKQLMEDCERGLIQCIVVKDLSRIGRNLIETNELRLFPGLWRA